MRKKQLIIIGAPKSGTTTLASLLNQSENFRLGDIKEPKYYTNFDEVNWTGPNIEPFIETLLVNELDYENNFKGASDDQWCIDASTDYLWCPVSAEKIKDSSITFDTKIICILRDPVSRAISEYAHTRRDNLQDLSLIESFQAEDERIKKSFQPLFYHKLRSSYSEQVKRYLNLFSKEQLLFLEFNELKNEQTLVDNICDFLDVDRFSLSSVKKENVSSINRFQLFEKILNEENPIKLFFSKVVPSPFKSKLYDFATSLNSTKMKIRDEEKEYVKQVLSEEVKKCKEILPINTELW